MFGASSELASVMEFGFNIAAWAAENNLNTELEVVSIAEPLQYRQHAQTPYLREGGRRGGK